MRAENLQNSFEEKKYKKQVLTTGKQKLTHQFEEIRGVWSN